MRRAGPTGGGPCERRGDADGADERSRLNQADIESILESSAIQLDAGCRDGVFDPITETLVKFCWGSNATGAGLANATAALGKVAK